MKITNINSLGLIGALAFSLTAVSANAHQHKHVNVKRDYKTVVVYTSPDPRIHRVVARKVIAAKKRQARIVRRTVRSALR